MELNASNSTTTTTTTTTTTNTDIQLIERKINEVTCHTIENVQAIAGGTTAQCVCTSVCVRTPFDHQYGKYWRKK